MPAEPHAVHVHEPRAVYVHVPFCRHRCGYCNFTVVAGRDDLIDRYLEAVAREMSWLEVPRPVDTLFVGGGTPTHLPPGRLARLLQAIRRWFPPREGYEWSVEANPEDLSSETLRTLADAGVTRLSLGVQSFDDAKLQRLERGHRAPQIHRALAAARPLFDSLAIDLIFASPDETTEVWNADLSAATAAPVDHVSCYGLTYERGARFFGRLQRGQLLQADEELEAGSYVSAIERLAEAGYEHYEVSNFARPGHRCRHNEVYWRGQPYFAVGPGAARYVGGFREVNHRSTWTYLRRVLANRSPVAERERLTPDLSARERLVFGLRMLEGVDCRDFAEQTGFRPDQLVADVLPQLLQWRLLEYRGRRLRLTRRGLLISDSIWPFLLTPESS